MSAKAGNSANRLLELVSDRVGLIKTLTRVTRGAEEPNPPVIYQADLSHFDFRNADKYERIASGKGRDADDAIAGAIGEAVERYCAAHVDSARTRVAPWSAVAASAVAPPEFVLYSARQYAQKDFPYHRWAEKDEVTWLVAREVPGDHPVHVPASFVFLASPPSRVEDAFCPSTSNGLAAGSDLESAVLGGLSELIERDGFLIHWMNRLPAPEVEFSGTPPLAVSICSHYSRFGIQVRVFNVSTDLPMYVMMAVALDASGQGPAAVVGLGCHADPAAALEKSLMEICQVRPGEIQRYRQERPADHLHRYEDVHTLNDHSAFLGVPGHLGEFDFLLKNRQRQKLDQLPNLDLGNPRENLDACAQILSQHGHRMLYAELTTSDVADYGLHVVRVLATGLQPIHFGFGEERLGGNRLFTVPERLGHAAGPRAEADLNPCPHPLA
jgi:ribosomal protein S12 methylthiotransferase accessory factor